MTKRYIHLPVNKPFTTQHSPISEWARSALQSSTFGEDGVTTQYLSKNSGSISIAWTKPARTSPNLLTKIAVPSKVSCQTPEIGQTEVRNKPTALMSLIFTFRSSDTKQFSGC